MGSDGKSGDPHSDAVMMERVVVSIHGYNVKCGEDLVIPIVIT